ncbi:hypothetical protein V6N13_025223 [Hibiscus sabdariffa]
MEVFGHIGLKEKKLLALLRGIDKALQSRYNESLVEFERTLRGELEEVLKQEELLWFQKSWSKWVSYWDQNTQFFHASTIARRRANTIIRLQLDEGRWCMDQDVLKQEAVNYFLSIFSSSGIAEGAYRLQGLFPNLDQVAYESFFHAVTYQRLRM